MPHRRIDQVVRGQRLLWVPPTASVREAARRMAERHVAAVVVAGPDERLIGIFTERDLLERVVAAGRDPDLTPISAVMTRTPAQITPADTVRDALLLMDAHGCRHLPVVTGVRVIGIVSMRDFVGEEIAELEHEHIGEQELAETIR